MHDRRRFLAASLATAAAAAAGVAPAAERDWTGAHPTRYPDADLVVLDKRFAKYRLGNTPIQRLHTGMLWAEGPAWNSVGRYLVWSDIPNDLQHRWIEDDGHVSVFRKPSGNSNGNTFDYEGRQISCEHLGRRVVRYEHSGAVTVLADQWNGKPLNAPNDVIVHPDGGIWFTDPGYGSMINYEGRKGELQIKEAIYRIDAKTGKLDLMTDEPAKPNGLCFSADYKRLYVADTGGASPRGITVFEIAADGRRVGAGKRFATMEYDGKSGGSDGVRCDTDGNVWCSWGWGGPDTNGVRVHHPDGTLLAFLHTPEVIANLCFGGTKRNRLFMCGSTSIYALHVNAVGHALS